VQGNWCYNQPESFSHELNLWKLFQFYELYKNHRQTSSGAYLDFLNRLREGVTIASDITMLETRRFNPYIDDDNIEFRDALALFPTNKEVLAFNTARSEDLRRRLEECGKRMYRIRAVDTFADGSRLGEVCAENFIPKLDKHTAGIAREILVGEGSRIMLIRNTSMTDGLVNGSIGTLRKLKWPLLRDEPLEDGDIPEEIQVDFDNGLGGKKKDANGLVILNPIPVEYVGNRNTLISRRMLPIVLCWAVNFHKAQGSTLTRACISISSKIFAKAMAYVALSRVKTLEGLCLLELAPRKVNRICSAFSYAYVVPYLLRSHRNNSIN
jgi:ATP-dependent exoDNAse (exonuclease V) alpha subunit